jgi:hypothetical protein
MKGGKANQVKVTSNRPFPRLWREAMVKNPSATGFLREFEMAGPEKLLGICFSRARLYRALRG